MTNSTREFFAVLTVFIVCCLLAAIGWWCVVRCIITMPTEENSFSFFNDTEYYAPQVTTNQNHEVTTNYTPVQPFAPQIFR